VIEFFTCIGIIIGAFAAMDLIEEHLVPRPSRR